MTPEAADSVELVLGSSGDSRPSFPGAVVTPVSPVRLMDSATATH